MKYRPHVAGVLTVKRCAARIFRLLLAGFAVLAVPAYTAGAAPVVIPATYATQSNATEGAGAPGEVPATNSSTARMPAVNGSASQPSGTPLAALPDLQWSTLRQGLMLGLAVLPESVSKGNNAVFVVLRIDPAAHDFSLHMASEAGKPQSLGEWSSQRDLLAGINASMYLPDRSTSVGYMHSKEHVNNPAIGGKLGAFFVADPKKQGIPRAWIIEHDTPHWREKLDDYNIVVQNYRIISGKGKFLWPAGGSLHSIAAVARDAKGRMLFLLSQEPVTTDRFAACLQHFDLGLSTVMYVEGGAEAGIFVRADKITPEAVAPGVLSTTPPVMFAGATEQKLPEGTVYVWKGRQSLLNTRGNPEAVLPNIIGVTGRK